MIKWINSLEDLQKYGGQISSLYERLSSKGGLFDATSYANLVDNIIGQKQLLFVDVLGEDSISAFAVAEFIRYPKCLTFRISELVGGMDENWDAKVEFFARFGRRYGAKYLEFFARPGFSRILLKRNGFKEDIRHFIREL